MKEEHNTDGWFDLNTEIMSNKCYNVYYSGREEEIFCLLFVSDKYCGFT